ncbi:MULTISPECIES: DegT/DnrJ/EryC1/StrS family aminotransferase [unclassified Sphingomonas]|uniref:DegT/DnrJ/EryC1/StrS family aminotransferase n=1 Tax=unclassified Sphingomonas TaxID=196159 RepID=UPI000E71546A|nr:MULTISPECIES: DegT/DnrJ/EryC1/StrS family aminotransferase [unclassified Sphingomonas]RKE47416.1 dTDP-4-amino-4,6-dideoxygalactose transaminase [Sphingomonas sp. PP-CC-1A-547]TCM07561.1 dTDP-4-amino-4,6-dideoxygalactose transaminase [Sphingomonas sp. PP-CC-3G-468]
MKRLPLIAPNPPRLSEHLDALRRVEASGVFSNNGPEVRAFEAGVTDKLFGGHGASLAVGNATLGLMLAIRHASGMRTGGLNPKQGTLALMPALTFAATAQAAAWAGLTPLVCDIDANDWGACALEEERLLQRHGERIGVVVPYATFGNAIDLDRYVHFQRRYGVGIVIDAASSLGTLDGAGLGFGARAPFAVVHSMHATKTFAVGEGGLIHSGDGDLIATLRSMGNFGFEGSRNATLPGINAKLPEITAIMAQTKLAEIDAIANHRAVLEETYRATLPDFQFQAVSGRRRSMQFMPVLLPEHIAHHRDAIVEAIEADGVGCGRYFSPHLGEQPWFQATAMIEPTPVADKIAGRMLSLPITDAMSVADARRAAEALANACAAIVRPLDRRASVRGANGKIASVIVIGGGPAGTAMLTSATKRGLLPDLVASGLMVIERGNAIGGGRLGRYAITSDSTAQTFLTAVRGNVHPELARLVDHPAGRAVAAHESALGVPLTEVGPLLRATGDRLTDIVRGNGGVVLTGHEALGAKRVGEGLWSVQVRRLADGHVFEQLARNIVVATGGHQPLDRLATQQVAGAGLIELASGRLLQSDDVLTTGGFEKVADILTGKRAPKIAVIGGSTSALTTISLLLKSQPPLPLGAGAITLLHRKPLRPFYHSVEAAHAEGFTDFGPNDICPVSGFVYRLAGFRLEARDLVLRMLGIDGRVPDPRVALHRITGDDDAGARAAIAEADLVIAALGYRPIAMPLADRDGARIPLAAHDGKPMVDRHCRIVDDQGAPIPGLYGLGLAAGFVPWGALGGESSFSGQANGLWLWQNDVGLMIIDQVMASKALAAA